ncbi:hypothetical protein LH464_10380 [Neorhizobium sp. T786]|uniref:hypothetical protein n=1 Tax=Pseudorhizobium xiangyangii TaxID=2883104 RepID=UPI001D0013C3|nr:hypothetical protein [Neorhizobium xiangyangii]MCB5202876.1 hypothetical protein [Neorhizobium xiangyangii]
MTKSLTSTFAAALIASVAFGGAALAGGDYYAGASKEAAGHIDRVQTNSVGDRGSFTHREVTPTADSGDYYEGANRQQ